MSKSVCIGGITNSPATLRYAQFSVVVSDKNGQATLSIYDGIAEFKIPLEPVLDAITECEAANKRWLFKDVNRFDLETLKPGTEVEADSNVIDVKGMLLEIVYSKDETFWIRRWFTDDGTYLDFIQTIEELDSNYRNAKVIKE